MHRDKVHWLLPLNRKLKTENAGLEQNMIKSENRLDGKFLYS
jgi:hypothetical protein